MAILLIAGPAFFLWTAEDVFRYSHHRSHESADAAIVLGAAAWNGTPSPVFEERINHAISLYRQHRVQKIIFTGGYDPGSSMAESTAARQFAVNRGVSPGDALFEDKSKTTFENLAFARTVAKENHLKTFLLVSDPLHMRRAMDMATDLDLHADSSPTDTSRYKTRDTKRGFLWRETWFLLKYRLCDRLFEHDPA